MFPFSFALSIYPCGYTEPHTEMASKDQRLKKCKTFPAGYVCLSLLCVHPRFCKISKQARREIQYLSRDFPSPRAKSGVSSEGSCSRRGNTNLRFFFFSPFFSRCQPSSRNSPSAVFPNDSLASALQAIDREQVLPQLQQDLLWTSGSGVRLRLGWVGGWISRRPHLPLGP